MHKFETLEKGSFGGSSTSLLNMNITATQNVLNCSSNLIFEDTTSSIGSLRHLPPGDIWTLEEIKAEKERMMWQGREWRIVDNLIVHESIKIRERGCADFIWNFEQSLVNLAKCGIKIVCYNFTPIFYKVRTHLTYSFTDRYAYSLFDLVAFSAFDLFVLQRPSAESTYSAYQRQQALCFYHGLSFQQKRLLTQNILSCAQTSAELTLGELKIKLEKYREISSEDLIANFQCFVRRIEPVAKSLGLRFNFNIDNPCSNLLGLPSVRPVVL